MQFNRVLQQADIVQKTSSIMNTHQIETAFLRRIILYDDSEECRKLETSIARVQRDQRCVQRVAYMLAPFPLLAIAGVSYAQILQEGFPYNGFGLALKLLCELGLASLFCLVGFVALLAVYRLKLNRLRKECLQLVHGLLESRLQANVANQPSSTISACLAKAHDSMQPFAQPFSQGQLTVIQGRSELAPKRGQ